MVFVLCFNVVYFYLQLWFHLQHVMVDEFLLHGKCKYFRISTSLEIMHDDVDYSLSYFGSAVMLEDNEKSDDNDCQLS